jgi:hypothetical protein
MHTEIELKVQTVRKYIYAMKGIDIVNIDLKDGLDLEKLDFAYNIAIKYFNR